MSLLEISAWAFLMCCLQRTETGCCPLRWAEDLLLGLNDFHLLSRKVPYLLSVHMLRAHSWDISERDHMVGDIRDCPDQYWNMSGLFLDLHLFVESTPCTHTISSALSCFSRV
ncbi:unnamed protein product [Boreogadus saida]